MRSAQTEEPEVKVKGVAVKRVIRFGEFELSDPPSRLLKNGSELHLRPQVMRALLLLAENPGEIVTRAAMRETIWKDLQHVEVDRGIKTVVRELRKALGDNPSDPKFIETVRGVGYRFVAPEQLEEEPLVLANPRPRRKSARIWVAAVTVAVVLGLLAVGAALLSPEQPRMLLPRIRSTESSVELAALREKLNDELTRELIGRHSRDVELVHIFGPAEELSMSPRVARYAVDGHISQGEAPGGAYISMELIDRSDGTILWIGTYELTAAALGDWPAQGARELVAAVVAASE